MQQPVISDTNIWFENVASRRLQALQNFVVCNHGNEICDWPQYGSFMIRGCIYLHGLKGLWRVHSGKGYGTVSITSQSFWGQAWKWPRRHQDSWKVLSCWTLSLESFCHLISSGSLVCLPKHPTSERLFTSIYLDLRLYPSHDPRVTFRGMQASQQKPKCIEIHRNQLKS